VGLIAGCPPAIDNHHGVIGRMGERFLLHRLPMIEADAQAKSALDHVVREKTMLTELAAGIRTVLNTADVEQLTTAPTVTIGLDWWPSRL